MLVLPKGSLRIEYFTKEVHLFLLDLINTSEEQEFIDALVDVEVDKLPEKD